MKTIITAMATALLVTTTTTATAAQSCTVKTDTSGNQIKNNKCDLFKGGQGAQGPKGDQGNDGKGGADGTKGADGVNGLDGAPGATGPRGVDGAAGVNGKDAVAPLGSLSFAAATASFYGDGIGFGLSASNYSDLEGSIVLGFDLDYNWRVVAGITTDFNDRTSVSVGLGYSF